MLPLRVCLFGKFTVERNERELDCLSSAKAQELLCYLLLHRDRHHPREILATLLWAECTSAQSKKYLRQTLWQLQRVLPRSPTGDPRTLHVSYDAVRLESESGLWLDVAAFERAFAPVLGTAGEKMRKEHAYNLQEAVSLYRGDLLDGWYQDWCQYHRERLRNVYLGMLDKLMGYCETHREYENGLQYGERLLQKDRAHERTYVRLMRLQYLSGDRAGALRQFQRCATALQEELGVKPAKLTIALYDQICADQIELRPSTPAESMPLPIQNPPPPSLFLRLKKLRSLLLEVQRRVQKDIQEVEEVLSIRLNHPPAGKH